MEADGFNVSGYLSSRENLLYTIPPSCAKVIGSTGVSELFS